MTYTEDFKHILSKQDKVVNANLFVFKNNAPRSMKVFPEEVSGVLLEKYFDTLAVVTEENELMPSLEAVGHPTKMEYYDVFTKCFCFFSNADYLICRYDAEEYAQQKLQLDDRYIFQTQAMESCGYLCEPSEMVDGYHFRVLSTRGEYERMVNYPWYMTLIGYSDEKQEIIYLTYYNTDIDYHTSLAEFLQEECGWRQVR